MRLHTRLLYVSLFLTLAGCASRSDLDYVRSDMEELKTRLFKAEQEMGVLQNETKEGVERNIKGLQQDVESVRKGSADLQASIEGIKVDMQVLAGRVDDLALAVKKPADDLSLLKEDTDRRFAALEGRLQKLEKSTEAPAENPDTLYQKGLDAFKGGDTQKARELLSGLIERYPSHGMIANAHYWLGETYYSEKKYDQAILEFQEVIKNFPGKEKVPAAMLKQAMAFKELGDAKSARYVFQKLITEFPDSEEAKLAKTKLKGLR